MRKQLLIQIESVLFRITLIYLHKRQFLFLYKHNKPQARREWTRETHNDNDKVDVWFRVCFIRSRTTTKKSERHFHCQLALITTSFLYFHFYSKEGWKSMTKCMMRRDEKKNRRRKTNCRRREWNYIEEKWIRFTLWFFAFIFIHFHFDFIPSQQMFYRRCELSSVDCRRCWNLRKSCRVNDISLSSHEILFSDTWFSVQRTNRNVTQKLIPNRVNAFTRTRTLTSSSVVVTMSNSFFLPSNKLFAVTVISVATANGK